MRSGIGRAVLVLAASVAGADEPRLNQFQAIGTHNSYHLRPGPVEVALIEKKDEGEARSLEYSHRPLDEQLRMGIRQFELDLFADPEGGRFARPLAFSLGPLAGLGSPEPHDPEGKLAAAGTKVLHFPNFDFRTTVLSLSDALAGMQAWSEAHPGHHPVMVLLELKGMETDWSPEGIRGLEAEILEAIDRGRLLTPDDVRGGREDLRTAVLEDGWPGLDRCRGRFLLMLDNEGAVRDGYVDPDPSLEGRLLFPSCRSSEQPAAGWFKVNDAVRDFERIRTLVKAGFLVRTRADIGLREGRRNDPTRRQRALASGAQWVSTDFPEARKEIGAYRVVFPDGTYVRRLTSGGEEERDGKAE